VRARELSRRTISNIRQNLFFAFIYNASGVPLAAGVLYPTFSDLRPSTQPHYRRSRHEPKLGVRGRERLRLRAAKV
jgi:hypothetical protein